MVGKGDMELSDDIEEWGARCREGWGHTGVREREYRVTGSCGAKRAVGKFKESVVG